MGTVEKDPFPPYPVTSSDGPNQHQDPGMDEATRERAKKCVWHATRRTVFHLDELLQQAIDSGQLGAREEDKAVYRQYQNDILEEMLSRG